MVQGKITEAGAPTIQLGATTSIIPSVFTPDALAAAALPVYPVL